MAEESDRCAVNTLVAIPGCSPVEGRVRWDPAHSIWNGGMLVVSLIFAGPLSRWSAVGIFVLLTGASLLLGHSIGFHRRLIHRSFDCPRWLEYGLVWIGTAVGMSGPLWMIRTHDMRDWAQRQSDCHDYLAHRRSMPVDAWWQLHCRLELTKPPAFDFGSGRPRSFLSLSRGELDGAATADRGVAVSGRRLGLGGVGRLRAGERVGHRPLVRRASCPPAWSAKLAGCGCRRPGARRTLGRNPDDG